MVEAKTPQMIQITKVNWDFLSPNPELLPSSLPYLKVPDRS